MSTMTVNATVQAPNLGYFRNLAVAARAFAAALLAVPAAKEKVVARKEVDVFHLYRLAASYDSVMPNLANELRTIANRS